MKRNEDVEESERKNVTLEILNKAVQVARDAAKLLKQIPSRKVALNSCEGWGIVSLQPVHHLGLQISMYG
jgi:hypothetical protein